MNTETGHIYEGEKKQAKDVLLDDQTGKALLKLTELERVNYFVNTEFDTWYKTVENDSETARRDRMRMAFRAGWNVRESKI